MKYLISFYTYDGDDDEEEIEAPSEEEAATILHTRHPDCCDIQSIEEL